MKSVLITGATGVVGSALAPLFLNEPDTEVWLLLRAADESKLQQRLQGLFDYWGADISSASARQRVKAVRGDVSESHLGLAPQDYTTLSQRLTHIVHGAASVKLNLSEAEARRNSVVAIANILELVDACRANGQFRKLDYISTVGVAGRRQGLVPEEPLPEQREFHNTYESAKAEAERLLLLRSSQGLAATIHRPSMVVGNSRTGKIIHFQVFYYLSRFFSGEFSFGIVPKLTEVRLDTIPSDYMAAAIHWASGTEQVTGRILHLCSGPDQAIPIMKLVSIIRANRAAHGDALPPLRPVPMPLFKLCLKPLEWLSGHGQRLANLPPFLDYMQDRQLFDNQRSAELLAAVGIVLPVPQDYLDNVLTFYAQARQSRK